ncbi:MAG TPA: hypothetical protein VHU23_19450 [Rhizomicrobium sp.]|nr:hypothetical protein [Rhizomicrobium sp.]
MKLFLAFGAVEARPAALHDAFDGAAAILAGEGFSPAVVDGEAVLEFAERALVWKAQQRDLPSPQMAGYAIGVLADYGLFLNLERHATLRLPPMVVVPWGRRSCRGEAVPPSTISEVAIACGANSAAVPTVVVRTSRLFRQPDIAVLS